MATTQRLPLESRANMAAVGGRQGTNLAEWLTVERALICVVLLLATVLRLWGLGDQPLQEDEARHAWESWRILRAQGGDLGAGPLLIYGNALLLFALGASDAATRILPALAGITLVLLPISLRRHIGREAALVSAALLALSPTLNYLARTVDSHSLLGAFALLVVVGWHQSRTSGGWLYITAVALGLMMLSGQDAYTMALVLAGPAAIATLRGSGAIPAQATMRTAVLLAVGTVVLGATGLLSNPRGIQDALITPLDRWLRVSFSPSDLLRPLEILFVYEPLLLLFGFAGGLCVWQSGDRVGRFLVWWAAISFVFASLSSGQGSGGVALVLLPLAMLSGVAVCRVIHELQGISRTDLLAYLGTTTSLLVAFWVAVHFFTLPGSTLPSTVVVGAMTLQAQSLGELVVRGEIALLLAAIVGMALWIAPHKAMQLVWALAMVLLATVTFHSNSSLIRGGSPAELQVTSRTSIDVRTLAAVVADNSDALAAGRHSNDIRVALADDSTLRWYLRDQPRVSYGLPVSDHRIVIAAAAAEPPPGQFAAQRFHLRERWGGESSLAALWRWLTLRETTSLQLEDIVVYIRVPGQD